MEENSKWYLSTGIIVLAFIVFWPVGVTLLIIKNFGNFKIEKKNLICRVDTFLKKKDKNFFDYANNDILSTDLINILKKM